MHSVGLPNKEILRWCNDSSLLLSLWYTEVWKSLPGLPSCWLLRSSHTGLFRASLLTNCTGPSAWLFLMRSCSHDMGLTVSCQSLSLISCAPSSSQSIYSLLIGLFSSSDALKFEIFLITWFPFRFLSFSSRVWVPENQGFKTSCLLFSQHLEQCLSVLRFWGTK